MVSGASCTALSRSAVIARTVGFSLGQAGATHLRDDYGGMRGDEASDKRHGHTSSRRTRELVPTLGTASLVRPVPA